MQEGGREGEREREREKELLVLRLIVGVLKTALCMYTPVYNISGHVHVSIILLFVQKIAVGDLQKLCVLLPSNITSQVHLARA